MGMLMDIVFGALIPRRWVLDLNEDQTLTPEGRQQQLEEIKRAYRNRYTSDQK